MRGADSALGTAAWSVRTGGHLTAADKRSLLAPLARAHAVNLAGRLSMAFGRNAGRQRHVPAEQLLPPRTILTRVADTHAAERLTPTLLNHSHRSYSFAAALGSVDGIDVDHELLYAAALLHDIGLTSGGAHADFTVASAEVAAQVADDVGLCDTDTETIRSAITLHHSPNVTLDHGPVAYLLSAGAALDVVGLRSWDLSTELRRRVVDSYPRAGFKREFAAAFRTEAERVPHGRVWFLRRYGACGLAIRLAPFRG